MDILLNIGKYFGYVFWGFVVLGALLALGRGTVKNVLKLIVVALSALGTYFVSGIIGDLSLSIPAFLDAVNGFLSQIPATYIPGDALYVIIKFMVAVLVSPIAFLLLYLVLSLIFLLVYAILGGKKKDKKGLLSKLSGIVMGAVAGAVTCLTFLSPVWAVADVAVNATSPITPEAVDFYADNLYTEENVQKTSGEGLFDTVFGLLAASKEIVEPVGKSLPYKLYASCGFSHMPDLALVTIGEEEGYCENVLTDVKAVGSTASVLLMEYYEEYYRADFALPENALEDAVYETLSSRILTETLNPLLKSALATVVKMMNLPYQMQEEVGETLRLSTISGQSEEVRKAESICLGDALRCLLPVFANLSGNVYSEDAVLENLPAIGKLMDEMCKTYSFQNTAPVLLKALSEAPLINEYLSTETVQSVIDDVRAGKMSYSDLTNTLYAMISLVRVFL